MLWTKVLLLLTLTVSVSPLKCIFTKKTGGVIHVEYGKDRCRSGDDFCVRAESKQSSFFMTGCSVTVEEEWGRENKTNATTPKFCKNNGCWTDTNTTMEICCCKRSYCNAAAGSMGVFMAVMTLVVLNY